MYMSEMIPLDSSLLSTGEDPFSVAQAREQFPSLLEAAESGSEIVIARRGRPIAVLGPLSMRRSRKMVSLDSLIGSGQELWSDNPSAWLDQQRQEWGA